MYDLPIKSLLDLDNFNRTALTRDYLEMQNKILGLDSDSNLKEVAVNPKKGDLVVFPSYIDHKVAPVTKGIRYSVVAWYGGPPFK